MTQKANKLETRKVYTPDNEIACSQDINNAHELPRSQIDTEEEWEPGEWMTFVQELRKLSSHASHTRLSDSGDEAKKNGRAKGVWERGSARQIQKNLNANLKPMWMERGLI